MHLTAKPIEKDLYHFFAAPEFDYVKFGAMNRSC
jgi:hypothetical protein